MPPPERILQEHGVVREFPRVRDVIDVYPRQTDAPRVRLIAFDDITLGKTRRDLVKGLFPRVGTAVVWGPPKCGKSFWVFDLSMSIARGIEYRGRRVQQGAVVYCAFEGQTGMETRAAAYRLRFMRAGHPPTPFYLQPVRLDLVADHAELISTVRSQLTEAAPVLVVLDTLNRSIRGSESNDQDMSAYIAAADTIREAFQCLVVIVHHCGHDGSRPRGHTSLPGAVEAQIGVKRDAADNIVAELELSKDGPQGDTIVSRLEVVEVGTDEDGEPITSCVVIASDDMPATKKHRATGAAGIAFDLLVRAINDAGENAPAGERFQGDKLVVPVSLWRRYCYEGKVADGDSSGTKKKAFNRASTKLQSLGLIGTWGDFVWLT